MYNNEDLERFYFKYQSEALPHGQSLQSFCLNNNVLYNPFSKWYKDICHIVIEVTWALKCRPHITASSAQ